MVNKRIPRTYPVAEVLEVHDGDTLRLRIDQGFGGSQKEWIRLKGVGAPELREPDGPTAREDVVLWLAEHATEGFVAVTTFWSVGSAKEIREERTFVRYVGIVVADNGAELNSYLLAKGYVDRGE
jgi:endonuclease YncB( thermonuclease family)